MSKDIDGPNKSCFLIENITDIDTHEKLLCCAHDEVALPSHSNYCACIEGSRSLHSMCPIKILGLCPLITALYVLKQDMVRIPAIISGINVFEVLMN